MFCLGILFALAICLNYCSVSMILLRPTRNPINNFGSYPLKVHISTQNAGKKKKPPPKKPRNLQPRTFVTTTIDGETRSCEATFASLTSGKLKVKTGSTESSSHYDAMVGATVVTCGGARVVRYKDGTQATLFNQCGVSIFRDAAEQQTVQFGRERTSVRVGGGDAGAQVELASGSSLSSNAFRHGNGVSISVDHEAGTVTVQGGPLERFGVIGFDLEQSSPSIKFRGGAVNLALRSEPPPPDQPYEPPFKASREGVPPRFFVVRAPATVSGLWAPRCGGNKFDAYELLRDDDVQRWIDGTVRRQEEWSMLPEQRTKLTLRDSIIRRIFVQSVPTSLPPLPPLLPEPLCIANDRFTNGPPDPENVGRTVRMVRCADR